MIRIAFAGFRHGHVSGLYKLAEADPNVEIAAAYEADTEAREAAKNTLGVKFTHDDYDSLLKEKDIDVVAIGDYFGIRGSMVIKALEAGKHVYADKPLCTSVEELDRIEALAKKTGLKVGLMLDMRYNRFVQPVKEYLSSGRLGEVKAAFVGGQHPLLYGKRPSWYYEEGKHGGVINDLAVHGIDMIEYLTGLAVKSVTGARCWNAFAAEEPSFEDCGQFMAVLSNGAGLMCDVSYSAPNSSGFSLPLYWRFTLWGTKGVMEFSYNSKEILVALNGSAGVDTITLPETGSGNCLSVFLDELAGNDTDIDTETVFRVTRSTLMIQEACAINKE